MRLSLPSLPTLQLLAPPIILVIISLFTLYSIDPTFASRQAISLALAIAAFILFSRIDYSILGFFSKYIYLIMIISLILLLFLGPEVRGSVRWFDIFGLRIQVSEIIKPFFITSLAYYLASNKSRSIFQYLSNIALVSPIVLLTLLQPDLGSAIILAGVAAFMILMHAFPIKYLVTTAVLLALPLPLIYNFLLHDYQRNRITSFLNATEDPFGTSYNSIQALISVGSGKIMGKGFGEATQSILQFLPEHHTDFIFASISESLGFVGASIVLLLFAYFLYKLLQISADTKNEFSRLILYGIFALFLIHILFNIGMNLALLPVVGITLPFVSYGGSALITTGILLGIVRSIMQRKDTFHSYEIS